MKEKSLKVFAIATASISLVLGGAIFANKTVGSAFFNADASDTHAITLNSSTVTGLTSTASSGTFTSKTSEGNDVIWEFNNAKTATDALMALERNEYANNDGSEAYLANRSPITTLESVTINFVGSYVTLYGSINGTDYERVSTINASGTYDILKDYLYVKLCSGNQDKTDLTLTSLSITYSCSVSRYNPEIRDSILNPSTKIDKDSNNVPLATTSDVVFDETKSTTSLAISQNINHSNIYNKYIWVALNRTYSIEVASHSKLVFWLKTSSDAKFASADDGTTAKDNFTVSVKLMNSSWKEVAGTIVTTTYKANQEYIEVTMDLESASWKADAANLGVLRVNINRVLTAGAVYLDDFHIEEKDNYPTISYSFDYPEMTEANDLSNGAISICYGGVTDGAASTDYVAPARAGGNSTQSRKATISSDWKMWNYAGMANDLKNKSLTFDVLVDGTTVSEGKTANLVLQFMVAGTVYKTQSLFSTSEPGITRESVVDANSNTWTRITIDASLFAASASAASSAHLGFNFGYARTIYIDNLYIGDIHIN